MADDKPAVDPIPKGFFGVIPLPELLFILLSIAAVVLHGVYLLPVFGSLTALFVGLAIYLAVLRQLSYAKRYYELLGIIPMMHVIASVLKRVFPPGGPGKPTG